MTEPFALRITRWPPTAASFVLTILDHGEEGEEIGNAAAQQRLLPILKALLQPLNLEPELSDGLRHVTLPLDEGAGTKLALMFRLVRGFDGGDEDSLDRIELIARRIALMTQEEAGHLLAWSDRGDRILTRWAIAGLRTMLGGPARGSGRDIREALGALRGVGED